MAEPGQVTLEDLGIPPQFQRYVAPTTPPQMKIMAARGLMPAPPRVLLPILYMLRYDPEPTVAQAATEGLKGLPDRMISTVLDDGTHPWVLDLLARERLGDDKVIEHILLRKQLDDATLLYLAEQVSERLLTIVSNNQARLLAQPRLFLSIRQNPHATQGMIDRVEQFLRMNDALPDEAAGASGGSAEFEFPTELIDEKELEEADYAELARKAREREEGQAEEEQADAKNLWGMISEMGIAEKIQLAMKGNATARSILIRSPNKMVALATINSPRMTDPEVLSIAQNRNVIEEVLRVIANNKQWMRKYATKLALINNPKTPVSISMPLVLHLQNGDLKFLAKNRNVPGTVAKRAKEVLNKRLK